MAQNFVQDGVTLRAPAVSKIFSGTPVYITTSGANPATTSSGIDGIAMNTCSNVADDNNYITTTCIYQTEGVFSFKSDGGEFVLGDRAFIVSVDNSTATVAGEQEGARTIVSIADVGVTGGKAIGTVVGLGSLRALGNTDGSDYVQVKIATLSNSNLADA